MDSQRGQKRELRKSKEASGHPVRSHGMAGRSTARGQGWLQGRLELQDRDRLECVGCEELQDTTSKHPFSLPLRCRDASHQYQAGSWNALEFPSHVTAVLQGLTFHQPPKHPVNPPDVPWVPERVPTCPCPESLLSSRQGSIWLPGHCHI